MNQQFSKKTGEPGAISPVFLTLKPKIQFLSFGGQLKPMPGSAATREDAQVVMDELTRVAQECLKRENGQNGWLSARVGAVVMGQFIILTFTFRIRDAQLILPDQETALNLIHQKLRQIFN